MASDGWHRLEAIFTAALEQPQESRDAFVVEACGPDEAMRHELESLLAAARLPDGFLSAPALEVFAREVARDGWSVAPGDRIAAYTVQHRLGAGGMGEVWRAHDDRLGRDVAIKLLLPNPAEADARVRAFQQEARAAGALNHPNVLTVYDVGEHQGAPYLVTECLEGESLRARLGRGALDVDRVLDITLQTARGLGAAHTRGIVHRDLKPENVFLASDGRVKILDFGLATLQYATPASAEEAVAPYPGPSRAMGTLGYMAPEQARGEAVDHRADIFALGAVVFEMLTGCRPPTADDARPARRAPAADHPHVPPPLTRLVSRCLAGAPGDRFKNVAEIEAALLALIAARTPWPPPTVAALLRRPKAIISLVVVAAVMFGGGVQWREAASRAAWARTVAAPEATRLLGHGDYAEAFVLARQALDAVPDDPAVRQLWLDVSVEQHVITDPPGADVSFTTYRASSSPWNALGQTPLEGIRLPRGPVRLRVSKSGFVPIEASSAPPGARFRLDPVAQAPSGMVRVNGGRDPVRFGPVGPVEDFWIDRVEVTNRQYRAFVDRGGYTRRDYWTEPFDDNGARIPWEAAVSRFRDATGQLGPASWAHGTYPEGHADFPVGGVSWYEASAYAAYAGKHLPTMYHWYQAAALGRFADILTVSNFGGRGPTSGASAQGVGPFGTYDMAGNVKEWCATAVDGRRFLLGGAWNEPSYMFGDYDARSPFERATTYGFRLASYDGPLPADVTAPAMLNAIRPPALLRPPVSDEVFAVYRRYVAYDRTPLRPVVEASDASDSWVTHTIAFDAGYGGERLRAFLYVPPQATPPYQTVVFFPAGNAFQSRSTDDLSLNMIRFLIESGRAVFYPVYKGTFDRRDTAPAGPNARRDLRTAWSRDFGRSLDYLETRSDIDHGRLAFYGVSAGADAGVLLVALDARVQAVVLQGTGISAHQMAETDAVNYAPRIRVPTLMLNGRYDFEAPYETAQRPLFDLLGAAAKDKRHVVLPTGHALPTQDVAGAVLPWLDRYLGAVTRVSRSSTR